MAAADNMLLFHFVWVDPPLPLWGLRVLEKQFKTLLDGGEEKKRKKKKKGRRRRVTAVLEVSNGSLRLQTPPGCREPSPCGFQPAEHRPRDTGHPPGTPGIIPSHRASSRDTEHSPETPGILPWASPAPPLPSPAPSCPLFPSVLFSLPWLPSLSIPVLRLWQGWGLLETTKNICRSPSRKKWGNECFPPLITDLQWLSLRVTDLSQQWGKKERRFWKRLNTCLLTGVRFQAHLLGCSLMNSLASRDSFK